MKTVSAALAFCLSLCFATAALATCGGEDLSAGWDDGFNALLDSRLADVPYAEGRMFEVERDGATSVLFGTVHLTDEDVANPPPALVERLAGARELILEVTREEEQRLMRKIILNPGFFLAPEGSQLSSALSAQEWAELQEALAPYGLPAEAADVMAPWYLAITLSIPACVQLDVMRGGVILDRRIEMEAKARDVAVTGLENPEDVFTLFADVPYDEQVQMLRMSIPSAEMAEDMLETTKQFYKRGQIARIEAFSVELMKTFGGAEATEAADQFLELLLVERNRRWLETLVPKLAQGDIVVAVGALHLPGADGLLDQLARQGFTITRLDP